MTLTGVNRKAQMPAAVPPIKDRARAQWLLGFISAARLYRVRAALHDSDADAMAAWVDKYCRDIPLDTVQQAALGLVDTLKTK